MSLESFGTGTSGDGLSSGGAMEPWTDYLETVDRGLRSLLVTDQSGAQLEASEGFRLWVEMTGRVKHNGKRLYFAGNGGSAALARPLSRDPRKRAEGGDTLATAQ